MPPGVDALLFGVGGVVILRTLVGARRFTPNLAAVGLNGRWKRLQVLMVLFVLGYAGALILALAEHLEWLSDLTSIIFFLGAFFVYFSANLTRTTAASLLEASQDLARRIAERTAELEETNRRLREARDEAESATRSKSRFLASMSHEIRTPLTSILGYADLMTRTDPERKERLKSLRTIRRNGQHLLELINDVLDISKIEAGEMTVELLECSPWQVTREVRSLLKHQAAAKGLDFEIRSDGPIPEYVRTDPVRLRQILLNLVGNAIKFTEKGSVRVVVKMDEDSDLERTRLRFDVIDTGIGMAPQEQEAVFRPFRQASLSTTRVFGGTGLGLSISRRLARMLGGDIRLESTPDLGSTFSLTIDAGTVESAGLLDGPLRIDTATVIDVATSKGPSWSKRLGGRILLAEDGVDNRHFLSALLQQVGAEVTLVENGEQAVERALQASRKGKAYDAVLMDMQMPVLDGYEAVQKLRQSGYAGTIVALTAYAMAGDREKCLEAGCDDFMTKPIDVEQFLDALARYVSTSKTSTPRPSKPLQATTAPPGESPAEDDGPIVSTLAGHPALGALVEGFVHRLPQRLEEIRTAYRSDDLASVRSLAHGLRGAGGTYGLKPVTKAAEDLEQQIVDGAETAAVAAALQRLCDVCGRISA